MEVEKDNSINEINFIEVIYKILNILLSIKKPIIYLSLILMTYGFFETAYIEPQFKANTRILIEARGQNLTEEQNINFTSLTGSEVQTEIEIMRSNALIHNVIQKTNIQVPDFEINTSNSSLITIAAHNILEFIGVNKLLQSSNNSKVKIVDSALTKSINIALDTVLSNLDMNNINEGIEYITNNYQLNKEQLQEIEIIKKKFEENNLGAEQILEFILEVLINNGLTEFEILELVKSYKPKAINLSDDQLIKIINNYLPLYESTNPVETLSSEEKNYFQISNTAEYDVSMINWVRSNLKIYKEKNSNILNINFTSVDPFVSTLMSSSVSEEYLRYQRVSKESAGIFTAEYYQERVDELRNTQIILNKKILNFEKDNDFYNNKVDDLKNEINILTNELKGVQSNILDKSNIYQPQHPEMIKLLEGEDKLIKNIELLNQQVNKTRSIQNQLSEYISEKSVNEQLLSTYLNKLMSVSSFNQSDAKILEIAENSSLINKTDALKLIIYYLFLSLLSAIIVIVGIVFMDLISIRNRIQLNSQINKITGLDTTTVIPHLKEAKDQKYFISKDLLNNKVLIDSIKKSINKITSILHFPRKAILITSPSSQEGKTSLTILYGKIASLSNKRVLLIDLDLERKSLTKLHKSRHHSKGIVELINNNSSRINFSKYIIKTQNGYDILPTGNFSSNKDKSILEVSNSKKISKIFNNLSKKYDYIFCDTMPISYQPDTILLSNFCNIIVTVRHNTSSVSSLRALMEEFARVDSKKPIIIFNDINFSSSRVFRLLNYDQFFSSSYGYGYGYGYNYGYDYGYGYGYGYGKKYQNSEKNIFILLSRKLNLSFIKKFILPNNQYHYFLNLFSLNYDKKKNNHTKKVKKKLKQNNFKSQELFFKCQSLLKNILRQSYYSVNKFLENLGK